MIKLALRSLCLRSSVNNAVSLIKFRHLASSMHLFHRGVLSMNVPAFTITETAPHLYSKIVQSNLSEKIIIDEKPHLLQAFNISRSLDLDKIQHLLEPHKPRIVEKSKRSMIVHFFDRDLSWYMVVYSFGSICFFDCRDERVQQNWLKTFRETTGVQSEKYDNISIVVDSQLDGWCKLVQDHFIVKNMDLHNLNIISGILSRSVALKSFEDHAHMILDEFQILNQKIQSTKKIQGSEEKRLIPLIAQGNALKCDLLVNVRLLERPEISWNFEQYDHIFDVLNREFEIDERYQYLEKKLDFIQMNTQFYMELQHSVKSERAEWLIIILILTEVILAIFLRH